MLHYLPGCDVRKNHPEAIAKLTEYMKNKGACVEACCRTKEQLINAGDIMVQNCTLCELMLREAQKAGEVISTYEYVLQDPSFPWTDHHGEEIVVQDCLRTKDNRNLQDAVRACLKRMNFTVIEQEESFEKTAFDGVWINSMPVQECMDTAPVTMQKMIDQYIEVLDDRQKEMKMKEYVKRFDNAQVLVYCNGCEKGLKLGGMHPLHLVELIAQGL